MADGSKLAKELGAAMLSSAAIPLTLNWTDFIKTRMQGVSASGCTALPYSGSFSTVGRRMLAEEGIFAMWSTGIPASILRECMAYGVRIGAYPVVRDCLSALSQGSSGGNAGLGSKFSAGVILGTVSGIATTPFDLARIRVQAGAGRLDSNGLLTTGLRAGLPQEVRGSLHAFQIIFSEGLAGVFCGAGVNIVRSIPMTVGVAPVYEHTKHLAKTHLGVADSLPLHMAGGAVAGLVCTTLAAPADVLRTRVMQSGKDGGVGMFGAANAIMSESGPRGFFRGWLPAYMRLGPMLLFMPALTEQVRKRVFGLGYIV